MFSSKRRNNIIIVGILLFAVFATAYLGAYLAITGNAPPHTVTAPGINSWGNTYDKTSNLNLAILHPTQIDTINLSIKWFVWQNIPGSPKFVRSCNYLGECREEFVGDNTDMYNFKQYLDYEYPEIGFNNANIIKTNNNKTIEIIFNKTNSWLMNITKLNTDVVLQNAEGTPMNSVVVLNTSDGRTFRFYADDENGKTEVYYERNTQITKFLDNRIEFNATSNQTISSWHWFVDGVNQSNNNDHLVANFSGYEDSGIHHTITVNATNIYGTSNTITWTVTVKPIPIYVWKNLART